jgi:UDP-glucuronate 4-epimerase
MAEERLAGRTYLVTGGAGFIGSHLTRELLARGAQVAVVDDFNDFYDPRLKEANLAAFQDRPGFTLHRADIRDAAAVRAVVARHAAALATGGILHLAARAGVRPSLAQPRLYMETNIAGTLNLLEAAREHGVRRFVFASSSSIYGERAGSGPFREDEDVSRPISPYAWTKVAGEALLHTFSRLYGLQAVALRFFTVYGPAQRPDLAIHKFTRLIDRGEPIPVFGDGSSSRDYTYVDDTLKGVLGALEYDETPFEVFNLGESRAVSLARPEGAHRAAALAARRRLADARRHLQGAPRARLRAGDTHRGRRAPLRGVVSGARLSRLAPAPAAPVHLTRGAPVCDASSFPPCAVPTEVCQPCAG